MDGVAMSEQNTILDLQEQVVILQAKIDELIIRHNQEAAYHNDCRQRIGHYYREWWFRLWMFLRPPVIKPFPYKLIKPLTAADRMPVLIADESVLPQTPALKEIDHHAKARRPVRIR
jgi:hypothetical protein